ncbi:dUTP diphosphatase [Cytobacillus purgationiresistens]|uniref:Dimeric dUTPase (All-alpha-NTP-PPase superfamily) n=1 Tax=Cytobacillus purgationiresistens TaxID=863449 RepID=A0ABU0ACY5_9BACI|nr:dUTP diphosphatase [Cytobacillus purgationiresistens]MDQ0268905.1 dimeric dUTPase (all-alpha-NTP-PPase superfamily) [Cytobacillus purgationiresistens]
MNLDTLFAQQQILKDRIGYNGPDRFDKLILALLVELGECANEWRGFKFWSKDQEPRTKVPVTGWGEPYKNPLLEEYVDGLHFVLELGLEINVTPVVCDLYLKADDINTQFIGLYQAITHFKVTRSKLAYYSLIEIFAGLGEMLGFTLDQIEQAYIEKNAVNHERQNTGY